ncbi:response regulator [Ferrovibrio sp.]|uniref:response regulator transcription factor n=1 Tax=Ferrovibrio sp. TaxID=1917215 RepID=UPI0025C3A71C|nr:response regulator [Ferrovibrio sp.]MBX3455063.1 response regulator [Ferrovibrio sp.]
MKPEFRRDISILFGDGKSAMRNLYRQALLGAGFLKLREFDSMVGFTDLLHIVQPDVILMEIEMPEGDACATVHGLRHGLLGDNPFLPVILTTWDAESTNVRRAVNAGADDLLVKPVNTKTLVERIEALALARKPFVVTADYIGPDRRKASARDGNSAPLIQPPNPLLAKLRGEPVDTTAIRDAVQQANEQVRLQRLRQSAFRIAFSAQQVVPAFREGRVDDRIRGLLRDLIESVDEISRRVAGSDVAHVGKICEPLLSTARRLAANELPDPKTPEGSKPLDLLQALANAVLAFFNPGREAGQLANEVASAVARYRARVG